MGVLEYKRNQVDVDLKNISHTRVAMSTMKLIHFVPCKIIRIMCIFLAFYRLSDINAGILIKMYT